MIHQLLFDTSKVALFNDDMIKTMDVLFKACIYIMEEVSTPCIQTGPSCLRVL